MFFLPIPKRFPHRVKVREARTVLRLDGISQEELDERGE